ncbi:hypothetical protein [Gottschalkia acidurici]|uniref:hypothetical protein n=1 Tax=Clostridium acidurici TaxID=1556 RepID=UPI000312287E|nr:hypothetical protein [Gottschalkia acidurici]
MIKAKKGLSCIIIMILSISILINSNVELSEASQKQLKIGDITGSFKKSSKIVSFSVRNAEYRTIPTYQIGEDLYICIEDLEYYGYKREWDDKSRVTKLTFADKTKVGTTKYRKERGNILHSDIKIYLDGVEVKGQNMGGYSLVKIEELNDKFGLYFKREYSQEGREKINIKGKIKLPNGEVAPKGGIDLEVVVYTLYKTVPHLNYTKKFTIKEGKNYCEYEIKDIYTSTPIGYKIDNKYGYLNTFTDHKTGLNVQNYNMYTKSIEEFKMNYNNFDIQILKSAKIKGSITLQDTLSYYVGNDREIEVLAIDSRSLDNDLYESKYIAKSIVVNEKEKHIPFEIDVPIDNEYILDVRGSTFNTFVRPGTLARRPNPPLLFRGYYSQSGFVKDIERATTISVKGNIDNVNINVPIKEEVKNGEANKNSIRTYINGDEIGSINVNGEQYVAVDSLIGRGFRADEYKSNNIIVDKSSNDKKRDVIIENLKDKIENAKVGHIGDSRDIYINNKKINTYTWGYAYDHVNIIKIKDLRNHGFEVTYDSKDNSIVIDYNKN